MSKKENELTKEILSKIEAFIQKINISKANLSFTKMGNIEAWEIDGEWTLETVTVNSTIMARYVICEILVSDEKGENRERTGIYFCQHQKKFYSTKTGEVLNEYGEVKKVLPIADKIVNNKWVIKEC